ncbi:hypothetical protein MKX03_034272, partial [Papaver bracteatum]
RCQIETKCFPEATKTEFPECPTETKCYVQATKRDIERGTEEEVRTDVGGLSIYEGKDYKKQPNVYELKEWETLFGSLDGENCGIDEWNTC